MLEPFLNTLFKKLWANGSNRCPFDAQRAQINVPAKRFSEVSKNIEWVFT
jgi:hypothetical protein